MKSIHVLCLYNPNTKEAQLHRFLGELGVTNLGSQELSKCLFSEILDRVQKQDGVTIAAHVTGDKGILKTLSGQATILRKHIGSIDTTSVRELVEEVLEGGREAFELRRLKYGF